MDEFDPHWPHGHVTRAGEKARILATDLKSNDHRAIVAAVMVDGEEQICLYRSTGRSFNSAWTMGDLINAPAPSSKRKIYVLLLAEPGTPPRSWAFSEPKTCENFEGDLIASGVHPDHIYVQIVEPEV